jgi:hypothetical protein
LSQAAAQEGVPWRQSARTRKSFLLVHIASAGAWLGIDVVMAVLVFTALFSDDNRTKASHSRRWSWSRSGRFSPRAWSACSPAACLAWEASTVWSGGMRHQMLVIA